MLTNRLNNFFILVLFIWIFIFTGFFLAQDPINISRDSLINAIKADAQRHVENKISMKTNLISEKYKNNGVGLTRLEIEEIYEAEYHRLKDVQKSNPLSQLLIFSGFLAFLALVLFALLKDQLLKLINSIFTFIWNQLAGTRVFHIVALHKYRHALISNYGELKILFRTEKVPLKEVYVPLKIKGANDSETKDAYKALTKYKKLMVVGLPGSGKSMFCKHIALSYADEQRYIPDRSIPILLELHRLNEPALSIEEHLTKELERNQFPNAEKFLKKGLKQGSFMLIFDGLDDVKSNECGRVVREIRDFIKQYNNIRIIITCRTMVYENQFDEIVDQTLEIVEFDDPQIRRFLQAWAKNLPPEKSIKKLIEILNGRPQIKEMARNPFLLTIITFLYTDTDYELLHSRVKFLEWTTEELLRERYYRPNKYETRDKKLILQHLALFIQDNADEKQKDNKSISYETVLDQIHKVLPRLDLDKNEAKQILKEIVERSGLLRDIDAGAKYQFAHTSLQEFFASEKLRENGPDLITRFKNDPHRWREVVRLWCSITNDSTALVREVYKIDTLTALECLADAKEIERSLSDEIISHFKRKLLSAEVKDKAILKAFGVVASNPRPRGEAVFEFLEETLNSNNEQSVLTDYLAWHLFPLAAGTRISRSP